MQTTVFEFDHGMRLVTDGFGDAGAARRVVLLHGGGQTRHAWRSTAEALAERQLYAITVDLRGHGDSDWHGSGDYDVSDFVRDIEALLTRIGPSVLVGASLGGIVSLMLAARRDDLCEGLVLVDITPSMQLAGVKRIVGFMGSHPNGFATLDEAADAVAAYLPHRTRPRNTDGLRKNLRLGEDGRFRWHWDPKLLEAWSPERFGVERGVRTVSERLAAASALTVPTMLVRGRMSDIVGEEDAAEFLKAVPRASYVDLAGARHMVVGDRNDVFTQSVLDFLSSLPPAG